MTETAAWQSFEEGRKGVIRVGGFAGLYDLRSGRVCAGAAEAEGCPQLDDDLSGKNTVAGGIIPIT